MSNGRIENDAGLEQQVMVESIILRFLVWLSKALRKCYLEIRGKNGMRLTSDEHQIRQKN